MKTASAATLAILNTTGEVKILRADLYTITPVNGAVLRLTDCDIPLTVAGQTYLSGPIIQRSKTKQSVGISVDTVQVSIINDGSFLVDGKPIVHQFKNGYFKGATVSIQKLFLLDFNDTSPGGVPWFTGVAGSPACDFMSANFEVRDFKTFLNKQMPEDVHQSTCNNQLFDNVCGAAEASFSFTGTATSVVDQRKFTLTGTSQANGYFALGKVKFTSGANVGQPARTIKSYVGGVIEVFHPFPYPIANGDALVAVAGCDKIYGSGCAKFARQATGFNATPAVPVPETVMEGGGVTGTAASSGFTGTGIVGSAVTAAVAKGSYQP